MKSFFLMGALCAVVGTVGAAPNDQYTEGFWSERPFDLQGFALTFTPDGPDEYDVGMTLIDGLPVDHSSHERVVLGDDDSEQIFPLFSNNKVTIFGAQYAGINIGSNGYITFSEHDDEFVATLENHFATARISTLYTDLDPSEGIGQVKVAQLDDRVVVTFDGIPLWSQNSARNTFQTELFFDGRIRMSWETVNLGGGNALVGLSNGDGAPALFYGIDFSFFDFDLDADGMDDDWEEYYFGHFTNCVATNNFDGDALDNLSEFVGGSDPRDRTDVFGAVGEASEEGFVIRWSAMEGRTYSIYRSTDLEFEPFTLLQGGLAFPSNSFMDTASSETAYYALEVEMTD